MQHTLTPCNTTQNTQHTHTHITTTVQSAPTDPYSRMDFISIRTKGDPRPAFRAYHGGGIFRGIENEDNSDNENNKNNNKPLFDGIAQLCIFGGRDTQGRLNDTHLLDLNELKYHRTYHTTNSNHNNNNEMVISTDSLESTNQMSLQSPSNSNISHQGIQTPGFAFFLFFFCHFFFSQFFAVIF